MVTLVRTGENPGWKCLARLWNAQLLTRDSHNCQVGNSKTGHARLLGERRLWGCGQLPPSFGGSPPEQRCLAFNQAGERDERSWASSAGSMSP